MPSTSVDQGRDYGFADRALALRKRAGLTQRELGALLGVSVKAIGAWEAGLSYPAAERLQSLVALYLERGAFAAGEEAATLWEGVRAQAPQRTPPFDQAWFATLPQPGGAPAEPEPMPTRGWYDWGDAPAVPLVRGRAAELAALARWLREGGCRVAQVLGPGGIGKTTLAARLARDLAPAFAVVYWRSLRDAPPAAEWLAGAIAALSAGQATVPDAPEARVRALLALLRERRALLVLDNLEAILEPGALGVRYRTGCEGYGAILERLAEGEHQSCLLLTSREQPLAAGPDDAGDLADGVAVRALRLGGLGVDAARALLGGRGLAGDEAAWRALVDRYAGNPLALRVVGETIGVVFGGDVAAFLSEDTAVFGDIRQLLDAQVGRLSPPERAILNWLAVEREPVEFAALADDLGPEVARAEAVEAVEALRRRSLLEWGAGGAFSPQPVVLEYATARLVDALADEIMAGEPALLLRLPVIKATARDYVRRAQERLIARPLLDLLTARGGGAAAARRRLLDLLEGWRGRPAGEQGYGPGSAANLLRLLRGDLHGLDLSHVALRQAYLQGVEARDASLAGAHLADAALPDAFNFPTAVALDAGGEFLAAGTVTGEVLLWRVADRALLLAVRGHASPVYGVALSGDGRLLASGGEDGAITLWDAMSDHPQPRATLRGHAGGVHGVALTRDGRLLASGGLDGTVRLWDAASGRPLATLRGHDGPVSDVALSADGRIVASGGHDGTVRLWEAGTERLVATMRATPSGHGGGFLKVALSGDGALAASGDPDGTVMLWDAASDRPQPRATLRGHTGGVYGVALSGDGRRLASGSYDGTVRLWDTATVRPLATLREHTGGIQSVALSGDGSLTVSGGLDGTVRLWDTTNGRPLATLQGYSGGIFDVALSGDGRMVAGGGHDGAVRLWDAVSGQALTTLRGHGGGVYAVALSADGALVASGGHDGAVRLWDAASGRTLTTLRGHGGGVYAVALSADGSRAASASEDGTVRLWDAVSGRALAAPRGRPGMIYGMALSGDGRFAASSGLDRTVRLWEVGSGQELDALRGHADVVMDVALDRDGRLAASGSNDGAVRLWDVPSGRALATLRGHASGVTSVALSGDGALVASGGFDGTARLWDAASGRALATLRGHAGPVYAVALSEDGALVASGGFDGTIRLWDATSGALLRALRPDRPYERMDITGLTGVTEAQRASLRALGAVERAPSPSTLPPTIRTAEPESPAAAPVTAPPALAMAPDPTPELASARPPDRPPTNLPPDRSSFVGRAADLAALSRALDPAAAAGARLLTLSGVAGSGKTRLALAVAEMVRGKYDDGAWLVELASLATDPSPDPTAVADAALTALGLREQPGQEAPDTLVERLRERRLLLVLDNCEHLVAACAVLAARLLEACPEARILATSQRPLRLPAETVWPVAPLALPDLAEGAPTPETLRALGQADAVRLFVERARTARPGFALDAGNAVAVVEICRALDGLPLAIELAAARLHVLAVNDLLARLDDRFRLLGRGGRGAADRRQTLQATMDWSYALLSPVEQALLRRCAVFAGGWELAAAEAVCAGEEVEEEAVLGLLDELLDRSLVYVYDAGGEPRYGLLETVRQYGAQQLERAGETEGVRGRHLAWCATLAERAAPALQGPEQAAWLARLERERDNLRAALQGALDRGLGRSGLLVAVGVWLYWRHRGYASEGRRWLVAMLALVDGDATLMELRADASESAAWLAEDEHDFTEASTLFARAAALRSALGQGERLAGLLINAAMEARARGDYARSTALLEETLAEQRARGDRGTITRNGLGLTLARLALVSAEQGAYARATALYEECVALHREVGNREGAATALLGLADIARDLGDAAGVRAYCAECLEVFEEFGLRWAIGFALNNLAWAAYLDGDLATAARRAEESAAVFRDMQAGPSLAEALVTRGRVRGARGEGEAARADLAEALTLAAPMGPRLVVAAALDALGVLAVGQGQARSGARLLSAAARLREAMGTPARPADRSMIEGALAAARAALGDAPFAEAWAAGQALPVERLVAQVAASPGDDTNG